MSTVSSQLALANQTQYIIGRQEYLDAIYAAITDKKQQSHALYFVAPGGLGKTRLLQEIVAKQGQWNDFAFRCTPLIDLYHADFHSPDDLRQAIISGLDPQQQQFPRFFAVVQAYKHQLQAGASDRELEQQRRKLDTLFLQEYKSFAQQHRLVICLDTLELVQHEDDFVMRVCQVENIDTVIKTWMVHRLSKLPNTVILLAGRPHSNLQQELEKHFRDSDHEFTLYNLGVFSLKETQEFIDALATAPNQDELRHILDQNPGLYERIFDLTQGKPIYLALIVDFLLLGSDIGALFPADTTQAVNVSEAELGKRLVRFMLQDLPYPVRRILFWLLFARKGLDQALLHYLEPDWSKEQVQQYVLEAEKLAVVKVRQNSAGNTQLFLHDELYDIFDQYFKGDVLYGRDYLPVAEYYRQQLQTKRLSPEERKELQVASLYYELQINLDEGYHKYYTRWSYEAIKDHELNHDMRLRDEILRFLNRYTSHSSTFYDERIAHLASREQIDRDCAVRWIWRHFAHGESTKAREVANKLWHSDELRFNWEQIDDPLYKADLLTALATAGVQEGLSADSLLRQAIDFAQNATGWSEWERTRILGLAYDQLGYLHRTTGHYSEARQQYLNALPYFRKADLTNEYAMTLNNLAYVLALLGRPQDAQEYVDRALETRRQVGHRYRIALSLNTRGRIFTLQDHPDWGIKMSEEALEICTELGADRGMGLAYNALGFSWRKNGNQWKLGVMSLEEAENAFQESETYLQKAVDLFTTFHEPIRLWEAYNELGSLYNDWAWLHHQHDNSEKSLACYESAIRFQEKAGALAEQHTLSFQLTDAWDDLAETCGDMSRLLKVVGRNEEANKARNRAEDLLNKIINERVPSEFQLMSGKGFQETAEAGEAYWLSMGKANLWLGVWRFRDVIEGSVPEDAQEEVLTQTARHLILAVAYFHRYNPTSYDLRRTLGYLSRFFQQINRSDKWALQQVKGIEKEFAIDLGVVHDLIQQTLAL